MTTTALRKRLDKIKPPAPSAPYTAPAPDARTLEAMRAYLAGRPVADPGASDALTQAMNEYLAGNGPLIPC